jgi:HAE1 family hydrophobic/amphiphilic exporter-1
MDFYRDWIEKPRRVILLLAFLCILTATFALSIPLGYLPRSMKKSVLITLEYRGAFEQEIERAVVDPLEASLSVVAGITEISSVCERGRARLLVSFSGRTDLDAAFLAVREIVYAAQAEFPPDVQRPVILKSDATGKPVFIAGFPGGGGPGEGDLKGIFENVEGSGEVEIAGSAGSEVVIRYYPQKLPVSGVELADLIHSVRKTNVLGGFGRESGPAYLLDSRFQNIDELLNLTISPGVRLRDLADAGLQNRRAEIIGRVNGQERLILYVQPEGDANVLALCSRLERLSQSLPDAEILYSYGRLVRKALVQVLYATGIGICCVVMLTFLFMRRILPSLLLSANIPFSIAVSLALLRIAGEQLNVLSLSGIAVGIGLVIDAGVIFVEEFFRSGNGCRNAIAGSRGPILFAAATTTAVFLPLLFAPQVLIDQFRGLALSIAGSVAASCIFVFCFLPAFLGNIYGSRTVVPGSSRKSPRPNPLRHLLSLMVVMNRLRWPLAVLGLALAGVVSVLVSGIAREGFGLGGVEQEIVHFSVEYPSGYTTEYVLQSASPVEQQLLDCSGVEQVSSRYEPERASFFVQLADSARRDEVISSLKAREYQLGEAFLHFPDGTSDITSFPVSLSGEAPGELERLARQLAEEIQGLPQCRGILFHFKNVLPAKELHVDLQKAARTRIAPDDLYTQMYWALSSPVLDKWTTGADEMDIVLQAETLDGEGRSLSTLLRLPCRASPLTIDSLVRVGEREQVGRIFHLNRARSVRISVLADWKHRARVLEDTQRILSSFSFPPGYRADVGAEVTEQLLLSRSLYAGFVLAALLIFFILMFQFESLRISCIILLQIPGAFIFPLLLLRVLSWSLTLPVVVGLILTSGIVVNNGILVFVDLRHTRLTVERAYHALAIKLRPILVSSLTTIAGIAPLLLTGSSNRGILAPLSLTMATGIAGSIGVLIVTLAIVSSNR